MPRVFLLRHGETEWSRSGKHTGRTDIPLTDRGRGARQGRRRARPHAAGGEPPASVLMQPPQPRPGHGRAGRPAVDRIDERLVEWDYGDYEGITTRRSARPCRAGRSGPTPAPAARPPTRSARRADAVLADARAASTTATWCSSGTGTSAGCWSSRWLGLPATDGVHFAMDAAGWAVLGDERGVPRLDGLNCTVAVMA